MFSFRKTCPVQESQIFRNHIFFYIFRFIHCILILFEFLQFSTLSHHSFLSKLNLSWQPCILFGTHLHWVISPLYTQVDITFLFTFSLVGSLLALVRSVFWISLRFYEFIRYKTRPHHRAAIIRSWIFKPLTTPQVGKYEAKQTEDK